MQVGERSILNQRESERERGERGGVPIKNATIDHILERVRARGDSEIGNREAARERGSNGTGNATINYFRARASERAMAQL